MKKEEIRELLEDNPNVIYEEEFFDRIKSTSLLEFRRNINFIQDINPTLYLENKVNRYYQTLLNKYDTNTCLFDEYQELLKIFEQKNYKLFEQYHHFNYLVNQDMIIKLEDYMAYSDGKRMASLYLLNETSKKISEIVVDGLFKDTIYNVWINMKEIIRYHNNLGKQEKLIHQNRLNLYQKILEIDKMDNLKKIQLYNELVDKKIYLLFYQDWYRVRKHSYKKMKNVLFRPKEKGNLFCYKESLMKQVPIYELDGQDFFMLVSCRNKYGEVSQARRHCYILISAYNMEVFSKKKFIYGYTDFSIDDIMHVFENDIASSSNFSSNSFTTSFVNRIMTPDEVSCSKGYSEIQMVNKRVDGELKYFFIRKPNYLVVFDEIEERHLMEAMKLNIPIIVIPTSKYKDKLNEGRKRAEQLGNFNFDMILDTYTNGNDMEKEKRARR